MEPENQENLDSQIEDNEEEEQEESLSKPDAPETKKDIFAISDNDSDETRQMKTVAKQFVARAIKAEGKLKETKATEKPAADVQQTKQAAANTATGAAPLNEYDLLALQGAGITHREDIDYLKEAAKVLGKPLHEAINNRTVMSILKERQEERAAGQAAHTSADARGTSTPSVEQIETEARRGKMPSSESDMTRFIHAKLGRKQ